MWPFAKKEQDIYAFWRNQSPAAEATSSGKILASMNRMWRACSRQMPEYKNESSSDAGRALNLLKLFSLEQITVSCSVDGEWRWSFQWKNCCDNFYRTAWGKADSVEDAIEKGCLESRNNRISRQAAEMTCPIHGRDGLRSK